MIRQQKLQALVLSRRKIGEADRLVSFFTREYGYIRAIAKGVRRIPSARGAHLEPFTEVTVFLRGSNAGIYVGAISTDEYFMPLREQDAAFERAQRITALAANVFGEEDPHERIYSLLRYAWHRLPTLPEKKQNQLEVAAMVTILSESGLLPSWEACEGCGKQVPSDAVVLDAAGGWKCITCHHAFSGTRWSLSPRLFKVLRYISTQPENALRLALTPEESIQLAESMRVFTGNLLRQASFRV